MKRYLLASIIGILISSLAFGAALERRLIGQEDISWGHPDNTFTDSVGTVFHKLDNTYKWSAAYVDGRSFGISTSDNGVTNSAAIQAAINFANGNGGGEVRIVVPGTYNLASQGADPNWGGYGHCINMKSDVSLILHPGVILKLADEQSTDAAPVNIITGAGWQNVYIGGGGRITGNTAGQTGWTGGYGQSCAGGCIISHRYGSGAKNVVVENLELDDYFSNPVNILGASSADPVNGVRYSNLIVSNVGEGPQTVYSDNVTFENIRVSDPAGVMVGDGAEIAAARGFSVNNLSFYGNTTTQTGNGLDIYNSQYGNVTNVVVRNALGGVDIDSFAGPGETVTHDVSVSNVSVKNNGATGNGCLFINGEGIYNVAVDKLVCDNSAQTGVMIGQGNAVPPRNISVSNSIVTRSGGQGFTVYGGSDLSFMNITSDNNAYAGMYFIVGGNIDNSYLSGLSVSNLNVRNNGTYGLVVDDSGYSSRYSGRISNITADGNGTAPVLLLNSHIGQQANIVIDGVFPSEHPTGLDGAYVTGYRTFRTTAANINNLLLGTKDQRLTIVCDGSVSVNDNQAGVGAFHTNGAAGFACGAGDRLELLWNSTDGDWYEIGRSDN